MPDLLLILERVLKDIRFGFACVGATVDTIVRPSTPAAASATRSAVDGPDAGSPLPASGVESPAPEFDWVTWVIPAITDVLAEHDAFDYAGKVECPHRFNTEVCDDWRAWREHVAPIIAARIYQAAAAQK